MSNSDWIALGSAVATLAGVFVSVVALWKQMGKLSTQLMIQQFSDYTKRYQDIILNFPEDINEQSFTLANRSDYTQTMRHMRAYFDLCYEEWYLNTRKLIDENIWYVWKQGMATAFSKPAFRQAWAVIRKNSDYGDEFWKFVEALVVDNDA